MLPRILSVSSGFHINGPKLSQTLLRGVFKRHVFGARTDLRLLREFDFPAVVCPFLPYLDDDGFLFCDPALFICQRSPQLI